MWSGENDTKMLVWMKIFCFVSAAMKTDTFENVLVCTGPYWLFIDAWKNGFKCVTVFFCFFFSACKLAYN